MLDKQYPTEKGIFFMRKLLPVVFLLALVSCRKDHPFVAGPVVQVPGSDSLDSPDSGIFDGLLNLDGIHFSPSGMPLILASKAYGRDSGNGNRKEVSLTSSGWTHPSVVKFDTPWHGFLYWMAVTPYPNTENEYENPHIFCSNDGIHWTEPVGITNPIVPCPSGTGYNSDVNLLMDGDALYCYFRVSGVLSGRAIYVVKSTDGVNWSQKQVVCDWPATGMDVIAPSFVKAGPEYECFGVCTGESIPGDYYQNNSIRKMTSTSPTEGFRPVKDTDYRLVRINSRPWGPDQEPWHLEVRMVNKIWLLLVTTTNHGGYGAGGRLFLGYSTDGINFVFGHQPLINLSGTYKSSFIPSYNPETRTIHVQLWRAMMANGWTLYYEEFNIQTQISPLA